MSSTLVTRRASFECAYFYKRNGKTTLNAHEYKIEVTVGAPDRVSAVVISFEELKEAINRSLPKNKILLSRCDDLDSELMIVLERYDVPYDLTMDYICAETLVNVIAQKIEDNLSDYGVILWEVKLRENSDSIVTWNRSDKRCGSLI